VTRPQGFRLSLLLGVGSILLTLTLGFDSPLKVAANSDPVIATAGDVACDPTSSSFNNLNGSSGSCRMKYTSNLLTTGGYAAVLPLGDNQYYCGGYLAYQQSYGPTWGQVKSITYPVVGNHEYLTSGGTDCDATGKAAGYFNYFGAAAGDPAHGYYSYDIGTWHLIALNTNCGSAGGCGTTSAQGKWLQADLAAHTNFCTLAYMHIPLYSSGGRANANSKSMWQTLYNANADLILTAHDHTYERFAPQDANGNLDVARGMREFVIGTGGANHTSFTTIMANSEVRNSDTFGILQLALHPTSYDWVFVPEAGKTFTDSGTTACHGPSADTTPPTAPSSLTATAVSSTKVNLSWTASTDNVGVTGYRINRDGVQIASSTTTSYSDATVVGGNTYSYTVTALDAAGNVSAPSNVASVSTQGTDTIPPTAPSSLSATAVSSAKVNLTWTASTDNIGVTGYRVTRDGVQVGTSATTSYSDATVAGGSTYSYTVTAVDAAGNVSAPSNAASVTTPVDTTPPSAPTNLTATPSGTSGVSLSWTASTDDSGVAPSYRVFRDGTQAGTTPAAPYTDSGLQLGSTYSYYVKAVDSSGNVSAPSGTVSVTLSATLTLTPTADAQIQQANPTTNYGSSSQIGVDFSPNIDSLIKFTVSGVGTKKVTSAKLRLYCVNASKTGAIFHAVADSSWIESTVTWSTAPAGDPGTLATLGTVVASTWYEVDLTPYITGDGTYTLRITSTNTDGAFYSSKEATGNTPQLVVTLG
jgi:acid phosphatase type 7